MKENLRWPTLIQLVSNKTPKDLCNIYFSVCKNFLSLPFHLKKKKKSSSFATEYVCKDSVRNLNNIEEYSETEFLFFNDYITLTS